MKNKSNKFYLNQDLWFQKSPEYFNSRYFILTIFIIGIYSLYTIISIPLYIYYHFFGDLGLLDNENEIANNPALREEFMNNFRLNDISFFWNIFNNIYIIGFAVLCYIVLKSQTFSNLGILMLILKIFIFAYFMNCNLTLIPHRSSFAYTIFNIMIIFCFILQIIYFISYYYRSKKNKEPNISSNKETLMGKYKVNERQMSIDSFVDEIQLRMDMAKIKFNSILIKLKLHKIFKKLMFKPKDYYFMKKENEKEKNNEHIIRNIKGYKNRNEDKDKKNKDNNRNSISENNSTTFDSSMDNNYSKLNDDNETSPLNI